MNYHWNLTLDEIKFYQYVASTCYIILLVKYDCSRISCNISLFEGVIFK